MMRGSFEQAASFRDSDPSSLTQVSLQAAHEKIDSVKVSNFCVQSHPGRSMPMALDPNSLAPPQQEMCCSLGCPGSIWIFGMSGMREAMFGTQRILHMPSCSN